MLSYFTDNYPNELPVISVADSLSNLGLEEHLHEQSSPLRGSPLLLPLLDAVKCWVEAHPLSFTQPGATQTEQKTDRRTEEMTKSHKNSKPKRSEKSPKKKQPADAYDDPIGVSVTPNKRVKAKGKKDTQHEEEELSKKQRMRPATEVISRIQWDPDLPAGDFTVGYLDRFTGIIEKPFDAFYWEDISSVGATVLAIPRHRIQYFKYRNEIVWDKRVQLDNFFGSRGQKTIQDIVARSEKEQPSSTEASKGSTVEVIMDEEDEDDDVMLASGAGQYHSTKNRPSHFICIQVTDEAVRSQVQKVQQNITKYVPQLSDGCHPPTSLHVTLCMLKLRHEQDKVVAKEVMRRCQGQLVSLLPRCLQLVFEGVGNFRNRLVYVKVREEPALTKLVEFLMEQLQLAGIQTPGNHDKFTPHMTIVKLSRPLCRELHTDSINPSSYESFLDTHFGEQCMKEIFLCSIADSKESDGFYLRLATVSNSLLALSPSVGDLVKEQLVRLSERGYLTEYERDQQLQEISSAIQNADHEKFETVVSELLFLNKEADTLEAMAGKSTVVILRGLPGSGKSHLAEDCTETKTDPSQVAIVSADDFFLRDGHYEFVASQAYKAHQHCIQQLLDALLAKTKLIVIDNTNSRIWEYRLYLYLSEILGCKCHVLEIPCPTTAVAEKFGRRNQHSVGLQAVTNMFKRWEEDKKALLVPPTIAYPFERPRQMAPFSLLALCHDTPVSNLDQFKASEGLIAVYVGVFLSVESQWNLLCSFPPAHPHLHASHVTIVFQPSHAQLSRLPVGRKVTVKVVGSADNGRIQAVAVELPRKLTSTNKVPHITISTEEGVPPKLADSLLQSQLVRCSQTVSLEGVIGVVFREATKEELDGVPAPPEIPAARNFVTITTSSELKQLLPSVVFPCSQQPSEEDTTEPSQQKSAAENITIVTGDVSVTKLFIFDFDGTLFDPPGPVDGRREYERLTRTKWPHKGWLGWPASLLPPLKVLPGPALPEFHSHHGCAGSLTVLLTGRIENTRQGVLSVMENAQLFPHRVILKPDMTDLSTADFKVKAVKQLLKEFPGVTLLKFWDDLPKNIAAMQWLSQTTSGEVHFELIDATRMQTAVSPIPTKQLKVSTKNPLLPQQSPLVTHLTSYGLLPTRDYKLAVHEGVEFLSTQFAQLVSYAGTPTDIAHLFGSQPLGRRSDVDLCLLAPATASPMEWITRFSTQLEACGMSYLHVGHSSRCPRLTVLLQFAETPSIEFDVVVAVVEEQAFSKPALGGLSPSQIAKLRKSNDSQSKAALAGMLFLERVEHAVGDVVTMEEFGVVVEMIVQLLVAKRQKGNAFSSIRTFHVVQLLADFIQSHSAELGESSSPDSVLQSFVAHVSQLSLDKWITLVGDTVPESYIPELMTVFQAAGSLLTEENGHPSSTCYAELLQRTEFPPKDHTTVGIKLSGSNNVLKWKARTIIEARLPTYIRQLISMGLHVARDTCSNVRDVDQFCFAVPSLKSARETLQSVLRPFWNELSEYRKKQGLQMQLTFGQPSTNSSPAQSKQFLDQVHSFASSTDKELHLPSTLTGHDRLLVHEAAERLGLQHTTVSSGKTKHIVLRK